MDSRGSPENQIRGLSTCLFTHTGDFRGVSALCMFTNVKENENGLSEEWRKHTTFWLSLKHDQIFSCPLICLTMSASVCTPQTASSPELKEIFLSFSCKHHSSSSPSGICILLLTHNSTTYTLAAYCSGGCLLYSDMRFTGSRTMEPYNPDKFPNFTFYSECVKVAMERAKNCTWHV